MEKIYYPALHQVFGSKRLIQILKQYHDPGLVWKMLINREFTLSPAEESRVCKDIETFTSNFYKARVNFTFIGDSDYPEKLASIPDPPAVLYYRGNIKLLKPKGIAMVGTRKVTAYGRLAATQLSQGLHPYFTIISGLARGIDYYAHISIPPERAIAVLGCGVDVYYPVENKSLQQAISEKGLVLSEFPPGTTPMPWQFPLRNRIISGLAEGIVVIEAQQKSGSLITAELGLEQGRDVFAIPGRIFDKGSEGTNQLIKEGAKLVTGPEDVLDEYFPSAIFEAKEPARLDKDTVEGKIITVLEEKDATFQEILNNTGSSVLALQQALTLLELEGKVQKLAGLKYGLAVQGINKV